MFLLKSSTWIGRRKLLEYVADQGCQGLPIIGVGDDFSSLKLLGSVIRAAELLQEGVHMMDVTRRRPFFLHDAGHGNTPRLIVDSNLCRLSFLLWLARVRTFQEHFGLADENLGAQPVVPVAAELPPFARVGQLSGEDCLGAGECRTGLLGLT